MSTMVDLDIAVDAEYTMDEPFEEMANGKYYPITIKKVFFRGQDITGLLHVSHVMTLQRRLYNRIINHQFATKGNLTPPSKYGDPCDE